MTADREARLKNDMLYEGLALMKALQDDDYEMVREKNGKLFVLILEWEALQATQQ